jgi:hypothetical protein
VLACMRLWPCRHGRARPLAPLIDRTRVLSEALSDAPARMKNLSGG